MIKNMRPAAASFEAEKYTPKLWEKTPSPEDPSNTGIVSDTDEPDHRYGFSAGDFGNTGITSSCSSGSDTDSEPDLPPLPHHRNGGDGTDPLTHYRIWTDNTGTFTTLAQFRCVSDGLVSLSKPPGEHKRHGLVRVEMLSEADRELVRTGEGRRLPDMARVRVWESRDGGKVEGELEGYAKGMLKIRKADGGECEVEMGRLKVGDWAVVERELGVKVQRGRGRRWDV